MLYICYICDPYLLVLGLVGNLLIESHVTSLTRLHLLSTLYLDIIAFDLFFFQAAL